jgi:hypothetical protein
MAQEIYTTRYIQITDTVAHDVIKLPVNRAGEVVAILWANTGVSDTNVTFEEVLPDGTTARTLAVIPMVAGGSDRITTNSAIIKLSRGATLRATADAPTTVHLTVTVRLSRPPRK